jgi:hypothetical protein
MMDDDGGASSLIYVFHSLFEDDLPLFIDM